MLHPDLPAGGNILVLDGLGRCLHAQGRLEEAEGLFRESMRLLEELFGPDHPHVAGALQNLARLRSERGDRAEAVELGARALHILKEQLPPDDVRLADALLNLSSNQYAAKDYDAAEANLNKALRIWEAQEGRRSFGVSTCLNNLGRICEERGETAQGVLYHREAVAIRKEILGDHAETAFSLGNYGAALAGDGQWTEAARALEEALACYERIGQADTPDAATCRANLELCRKAAQPAS
ncbi:tetratricopeptide repeat protein [uncultured Bilophila sp.]|uniref:tetratricopeptide repeat protein n=1 Tax=uncultured Bilophila sp. TaxID=529385 RepID=UPI0025E6FC48|nr:tetratricopeptide repeat protein [uncultured Bilophila sp.]